MTKTIKTLAFARNGEAYPATVEVQVSSGIGIHITGLDDKDVKEVLLRTITAAQSMGIHIPGKKVVIKITGNPLKWVELLDYPILVALTTAISKEAPGIIKDAYYLGTTSLDGKIQPLTTEQYYKVLQWKYQHDGKLYADAELVCPNAFTRPLNPYEHRGEI